MAFSAGLVSVALLAGSMSPAVAASQHQAGRAVAPAVAGTVSTVAGGPGGPDPGTNVALSRPCGVSFGGGTVYVADDWSVKRLAPSTDRMATVAGTGVTGPLGNGGPALSATVNTCGTTVDPHGNLVIADSVANQIRVEASSTGTFYGQSMTAGDIYKVAGGGTDRSRIGNGGPAVGATLGRPNNVATDSAGNLLIPDTINDEVRVAAVKTGTFYGQSMTAGHIYAVAGDQKNGYSGNGGPATPAELNEPDQVVVDSAGNLVIADTGNNRVRVVAVKTGTFYG
ncbi:MAG: hypothetical protein ACRDNF_05200, partial [Streptosporangiaceae bacterium]